MKLDNEQIDDDFEKMFQEYLDDEQTSDDPDTDDEDTTDSEANDDDILPRVSEANAVICRTSRRWISKSNPNSSVIFTSMAT